MPFDKCPCFSHSIGGHRTRELVHFLGQRDGPRPERHGADPGYSGQHGWDVLPGRGREPHPYPEHLPAHPDGDRQQGGEDHQCEFALVIYRCGSIRYDVVYISTLGFKSEWRLPKRHRGL